jgi:predicted ATPase
MLRQINLKNFKCFENLKLPLSNITLLSGSNASGKSSALQALVLLHQTMREQEWSNRLILNGQAIKLGTVADVVDKVHGRRACEIGLYDDELQCHWSFSGERPDMCMGVDFVRINEINYAAHQKLQYLFPCSMEEATPSLALRLKRMTYITAERVGPREFYYLEDKEDSPVVGPAGEYAVSVLHLGREERILDSLVVEGIPPTRLRQVEARMAQFFPGCGLIVQYVPQTNAVTLGLRTSEDTDFHRPIHVGFGLTQVLPIVIAALSADAGELLLIENPEVHLHPAGQALMGQFLGEVANAGVQVIIESHSDHILNGIRRSVKSGRLVPDQVAIHFFRPRSAAGDQVHTLKIDSGGNIDSWPSGFFDQFDIDMNFFAGWGE